MASSTAFKRCSSCGGKLPESDGHSKCLLCLGEGHVIQSCTICQSFTPQARKNRETRLKAMLYEQALLPSSILESQNSSPIHVQNTQIKQGFEKKKFKKPNSVVADATHAKRLRRQIPTPPDKEGRKIDALGRRVHTSAALFTKLAHYGAYMGAYQSFLWSKIEPLIDYLPPEEQRMARAFHLEATSLAKLQKDLGKHTADSAGKLFATATSIRRHGWLRASALSEEGRAVAEDLPMDNLGLFNATTDDNLKHGHEMRQTMFKYGNQPNYTYQQRQRWQPPQAPYFRRFDRSQGGNYSKFRKAPQFRYQSQRKPYLQRGQTTSKTRNQSGPKRRL
nr:PREDICTED: uncharacterized protein LOC107982474 [Anolis carolinensis]|eukprot:XP_016847156.1 PREDICTED: uncharacterized protein LOC107982474 [Anolis carolinensis]